MPQLDILTFTSQLFWLYFVFFGLLILVIKYFLPNILTIFRVRSHLKKVPTFVTERKQSHAAELRKQALNDLALIIDFKQPIENELIQNTKSKDCDKVLSTFHKRVLRGISNIKFTLISFIIPTDEFILFLAFLISFVVLYVLYVVVKRSVFFQKSYKRIKKEFFIN